MTTLLKPWQFPLGSRPTDGFTLLELLIAVAISAIVLAAINTLFFGALHLREKAAEAAEQTLPTDRAIEIMKKDLLAIVPPGDLAGSFGSDSAGIGMSQPPMLELFSASGAITTDQPWGDVQKIDYSLMAPTNRNNSGGRDLVRGVTRNLLATDPIPPENHALLEDVQNLQFSYYDGTNWNDTWSTTLSNIPIAIKVSIDFAVAKGSTAFKPSVQFLVPVVAWSTTNSITNQISN
jgi:type II secretion system protein J